MDFLEHLGILITVQFLKFAICGGKVERALNYIYNGRRRCKNIICFHPPFSKTVSTNIGRYFLNLIGKHFPPHHKYRKIFNKNNIKVSYSRMRNKLDCNMYSQAYHLGQIELYTFHAGNLSIANYALNVV